jgi:hypothetical protein
MAKPRINYQFKHELKVKPLPAGAEEYARQYFINLMLTGHIIVAPDGAIMSRDNLKKAMETWG